MKTTLFSLALAFLGVTASPIRRAIDGNSCRRPKAILLTSPIFFFIITDETVLNFALTLEYLEADFYAEALQKFDAKAFADAGFPAWVRGRFVEIGQHETAHVEFLQNALGSKATRKCSYRLYDLSTFWGPRMLNICAYPSPYTDPKSFAALSQVLEGVGMWSFYIPLRRFFKLNPSIFRRLRI
jgi:hypothetical protein